MSKLQGGAQTPLHLRHGKPGQGPPEIFRPAPAILADRNGFCHN